MDNFHFDATSIAPRESFDPVPNGWYSVTITDAQWATTKAGAEALALTMEIDGNAHPQFANRKLWTRLNLNNASDKAREIAQRELSSICHAIGRLQLANVSDLLGASMLAKVVAKPAEDGYDARNEIKGYKAAGDAPKPAATTTAAAPAAAAAKPSWKRG